MIALGEPGDHRHMLLLLWCKQIGRSVKINVVFPKRLAVVGQIDHGAVYLVPVAT
ncbi:hypothetical protein D3C79_1042750 [compost metagenome]